MCKEKNWHTYLIKVFFLKKKKLLILQQLIHKIMFFSSICLDKKTTIYLLKSIISVGKINNQMFCNLKVPNLITLFYFI